MLQALFRRLRPAAPAAPAPPPLIVESPAAKAAAAPAVHYGVRRPLISSQGEVAGFEFRLHEGTQRRLLERGDTAARTAHTTALLTAMQLTVRGGRIAFAELPAEWINLPQLGALVGRGMMIGLVNRGASDALPAGVGGLRSAGLQLGWTEDLGLAAAPDFRLVHLSRQPLDELAAVAQRWRAEGPQRPLLATDAATVEDLEAALRAGAQFACGELAARGDAAAARPLPPQVTRIHRLLHALADDDNNRQLAAEIKSDIALSYRLLRFANSAALGLAREVDSVEQAMLLLGRNELHRWLAIMLLNSAEGRPAARALQEVALARAYLLESLARARGDPRPDGFFTLGMASMLGVLLQTPLAAAIEPLRLPDPAQQALLHCCGPWRPHLELALLLERHRVEAAEPLAAAFGGIERVLKLADVAWTWAAIATSDLRG
jgi:EAL and modified HD-GYP domain-containing signal transduction protein